jgi:hypothetical protein
MNRVNMLVFPVDWSPRKTTLNFARAPGPRQGRGGVGEGRARRETRRREDERTRRREDEKRNIRITGEEAIDVLDAILLSDRVVPRSGEA